ncbi:YdeI family protein [Marinilactibacillus sp. GCM10026970]|uniref:YdeI/OmpD-associated family protein n=1 Tax=Marinilactibacillus sp. GCM10026970 TaxID=3252642 RepID=UPI003612EA13
MDIKNHLSVTSRAALRSWLEAHSETEPFCWVDVTIKKQAGHIQYLDAVEEALCFGWIDSVKKKLPDGTLVQRLSPRKKGSHWTELNKERVRRLERLELMTNSGRRVLPEMDPNTFKVDPKIEQLLKADPNLYQNYLNFPELYRRVRIDTIQSYKSQPDLFHRRLEKFLSQTRENKLYGQWNDNGRLLEE